MRYDRSLQLLGAIGLIAVIAWAIYASQQNNQLVRPIPGGPAAPVVHELPNLLACLREVKTECEAEVSAAKRSLSQRRERIAAPELARGEQLYISVQKQQNGCIEYLKTALARRFIDDDVREIKTRFEALCSQEGEFLKWAAGVVQKKASPSICHTCGSAADVALDWLDQVRKQNDEAIRSLQTQADGCQLLPWGRL